MPFQEVVSQADHAGLCVLPARIREKRPAVPSWREFQQRRPTAEETDLFFRYAEGMCLVCGAVSGNLEMLDFDMGGECFDPWMEAVIQKDEALFERLVIERTPSGGYHVAYRCTEPIPGNLKLARRSIPCDGHEPIEVNGKRLSPIERNGRWEAICQLIETRGEGGLFLCAPTPGYELIQGDFSGLPLLTPEERDILVDAAMALDKMRRESTPPPVPASVPSVPVTPRPGDDFCDRVDIRPYLTKHGWTQARRGENEHWRRPGKRSGTSATLKDGVFYVFSSSAAPFEADKGYSPFQVYALLEHGGDFTQAASALREQGYGADEENLPKVDLSSFLAKIPDPPAQADEPRARPLSELFKTVTELDPPLIHGLLREGETMNVIASPKAGKSWMVMRLAISIASGLDWFGMPVEHGRVLHIDNELRLSTIVYRYRKVAEALKVPKSLFEDNLNVESLRGQLQDLNGLGRFFSAIDPGHYKAIIIDAFYRTLPIGVDENDNGAIANLYNKLDWYASRLKCAFILIHHSSKGDQSKKSVTDVGAGAGAQSRAADTHLILRPHEESQVAVLEAAVRSWPPREPMCLRWEFPLWQPAPELDPSCLQGRMQATGKAKATWSLEEFVSGCVMTVDPCSQNQIVHAAEQLGISKRQAKAFIELGLADGSLARERNGSHMHIIAVRPNISSGKAQVIAARIANEPVLSAQNLAAEYGVSERYIRQIRQAVESGVPPP